MTVGLVVSFRVAHVMPAMGECSGISVYQTSHTLVFSDALEILVIQLSSLTVVNSMLARESVYSHIIDQADGVTLYAFNDASTNVRCYDISLATTSPDTIEKIPPVTLIQAYTQSILDFHPFLQGGSYPPSQNGLHRHTRHTPFAPPTTGPYLRTARIMYSLHPGWNRHVGGSSGRTTSW